MHNPKLPNIRMVLLPTVQYLTSRLRKCVNTRSIGDLGCISEI